MADGILEFMIGHLKSCWSIKTSRSWLSTKLYNPQDQVGHLSLCLNGHRPSETGGHLSLLHRIIAVYLESLVMISIERSETAQKNALDVQDKLK